MKMNLYPKLAWDGIHKNKRLYIPYILTCVGMIMMFYIIHHLAVMEALDYMSGGASTKNMLSFGVWVIAVFAVVFLMYTNSFLMRRRKKEFGLYNILGMGKKNLSVVYLSETAIVFGISMLLGLFLGVALSKLAELGLVRLLGGVVTYDFTINARVLLDTAAIFGGIFVLLLLKGLFGIWRLNALHLLKSENVGEKPPRANYLLGIGGILLLCVAYYIAISIRSPLLALSWFFIAVIMVILATYMVFISGSVMLCRMLQKNKRYYYKKNHFVSVSSMVYRMKRNGAGLASICILSTMVLVMMLGAGSLFFGAEDSLRTRYPKDISASVDFVSFEENKEYTKEKADTVLDGIDRIICEQGVAVEDGLHYVLSSITVLVQDGVLIMDPNAIDSVSANTMENLAQIYVVPLDEYNACMGANETLRDGEVLLHCVRRTYEDSSITLPDGSILQIKKQVEDMMQNADAAMDILPSIFLVTGQMEQVCQSINSGLTNPEDFCRVELVYEFNTELDAKEEIALADAIRMGVREMDYSGEGGFYCYSVECREEERGDFYGTYGGIFYLGIVLSIVFILATVLIIYYKQITEGYEDESRFLIMQKVGMTKRDIRKSVDSQMLTVFALPLVTAATHMCFAFPMIQKILALFNMRNLPLMIGVMMVTVFVFGVFYVIVYKVTSNAYYRIVSGK